MRQKELRKRETESKEEQLALYFCIDGPYSPPSPGTDQFASNTDLFRILKNEIGILLVFLSGLNGKHRTLVTMQVHKNSLLVHDYF